MSNDLSGQDLTIRQTFLPDEAATLTFGQRLADNLKGDETVFVAGDLGAGKTTLIRGLLRTLGVAGIVRSPTYTLVEPYETTRGPAFHLDLYRLSSPEELEFLAGREIWGSSALKLVEWPVRGASWLPNPDLTLSLEVSGEGRNLQATAADKTLLTHVFWGNHEN